ncbi:MAG: DUF3737 family protein [Lachnospiraceae bacterium]|nr:DUF3737 family protein [Lachnospiraceae bacterium]
MEKINNQCFDEERALYGSNGVLVENCKFDGPADGESALKESKNVEVKDCFFNLRYPLWHDDGLKISGIEMTENCRAAIWYTNNVEITNSKLHGIKVFRECANIKMSDCDVISKECGWNVKDVSVKDSTIESEYFMMGSDRLHFTNTTINGKYSFQYISDSVFEKCNIDTKDALWHAKNVTIKDSTVRSEYLAWYSENVTFENCTLIGTQPLCYCKNLKLINCKMVEADFAFEKSEVEATVTTPVISIRNPKCGTISVPAVSELIMDDPDAKGEVVVTGE